MKGRIRRSALLRKQLLAFTRVLPALEKGDERALHRARVASRRLRELIPVLQLDARTARKLNRRTRKVTRRLGAVRELDVLLMLIDELYVSRAVYRDPLKRVSHLVRKTRDERRRSMLERLPIDDLWALARRFERVLDALRQSEASVREERRAPQRARTVEWAIDARITHRMARLASALEGAGAVYLPERLHAVRITLKKARYAFELKTGGDRRSAALQTMKRMQELLGRMHDLQVLIDWVREAQASLTPPNLTVWRELDALVLMLDESCRRLHARYLRDREALRGVCANMAPQESGRRSERQAG
jgi:CHAD domain-containing protein